MALDEALGVSDKMQRLAAVDSADILVIKAGRLGGLNESLELMRLAEDRGKGLVVTSSLESWGWPGGKRPSGGYADGASLCPRGWPLRRCYKATCFRRRLCPGGAA